MPMDAEQAGDGSNLTQASAEQIRMINDLNYGSQLADQRHEHVSILEKFCMVLSGGNRMAMVTVAKNRASGTIVTMDATGRTVSNRPPSGFRIDLQHYNTKDPNPGSKGAANFQIQTNEKNTVSLAEVHIPPDVPWTPAIIIYAFTESLQNKRPYRLVNTG